MRMTMPITGTVKEEKPYIAGDENDPIRMIDINLGNVSWRLVSLDLENEAMEIEVKPSETINDAGIIRPTTIQEKTQFIEAVRNWSLERMPKEALYALSKSPYLKNPFKKP